MASRPVREVQALKIVNKDLEGYEDVNPSLNIPVESLHDLESSPSTHPWVLERVSAAAAAAVNRWQSSFQDGNSVL